MFARDRDYTLALVAILAALVVAIALALWPEPTPIVEPPAPEVRQDDGSVILPREASGPITPERKPAHKIPKKARVERIVQVKVQPTQPPEWRPCPPVTVDMTLVREPDGPRRVITSSPDGQVVSGLDIPIETPPPAREYAWAAGLSLDPIHQTPGVWLDRTWRRLRIGVEINQVAVKSGGTGGEVRLRLGWVF